MSPKKSKSTPNNKVPKVQLSPEKQELAGLILKWSHMVDNPTKKKESDALFRKIWELKHGRINPF